MSLVDLVRRRIDAANLVMASGVMFGRSGKPHTYNPYRLTAIHARRHFAWLRGWQAGRARRLGRAK